MKLSFIGVTLKLGHFPAVKRSFLHRCSAQAFVCGYVNKPRWTRLLILYIASALTICTENCHTLKNLSQIFFLLIHPVTFFSILKQSQWTQTAGYIKVIYDFHSTHQWTERGAGTSDIHYNIWNDIVEFTKSTNSPVSVNYIKLA